MPDLFHTLNQYDFGQLKIIADQWGLELSGRDASSAVEELCAALPDPSAMNEMLEILPAESRAALADLQEADGRMEWAAFARRFGPLREMGAGRRDREEPHRKPQSTTEMLYFRGLLARAFLDSGRGVQEFAYIPDELMRLIPPSGAAAPAGVPLGRTATPLERAVEVRASDRVLDTATTHLAALRIGRPDHPVDPRLPPLLAAARILKRNIPQAARVKEFLEAPRRAALDQLARAWLESRTFNELHLLPGLTCEGEWSNDPHAARHFLLDRFGELPGGRWWSLSAFLRDLKARHPDFQRPAGDYDSWFIRREADGQYLRGFAFWDAVDGALVRFLVDTLHWLGRADLAGPEQGGSFTAFRLARVEDAAAETGRLSAASDGRITLTRTFPRAVRYQIARFCEWEAERPEEFVYSVSARSLQRAGGQGLKAEQLLSMLVKYTGSRVPPALVRALKRWEANGPEARVESLVVLRVSSPQVLEELRNSKAGRFLGETLGSTAVTVRQGALQKVRTALAELGLLADVAVEGENHDKRHG